MRKKRAELKSSPFRAAQLEDTRTLPGLAYDARTDGPLSTEHHREEEARWSSPHVRRP